MATERAGDLGDERDRLPVEDRLVRVAEAVVRGEVLVEALPRDTARARFEPVQAFETKPLAITGYSIRQGPTAGGTSVTLDGEPSCRTASATGRPVNVFGSG